MSGAPVQRRSAIVTRPQPESNHWVTQLRGRHIDAHALPLIEIRPVSDAAALKQAWAGLDQYSAVMFVSRFAVEAFFAQRPAPAPGMDGIRFWSTGPGTRSALTRQGIAPDRMDSPPEGGARFDSEALWDVVAGQLNPGERVLVVRGHDGDGPPPVGGTGRDWLAQRLVGDGVQVQFVVAYQRRLPGWTVQQHEHGRTAAQDGSIWLFTSAQALAHLTRLLAGQTWGAACALATHPRIAHALREAGFGVVRETRPDLDSVVASIESFE